MIIVDTPGTNVILQRQQRLTEEFVPRADLLLFVISADRPLTQSEVCILTSCTSQCGIAYYLNVVLIMEINEFKIAQLWLMLSLYASMINFWWSCYGASISLGEASDFLLNMSFPCFYCYLMYKIFYLKKENRDRCSTWICITNSFKQIYYLGLHYHQSWIQFHYWYYFSGCFSSLYSAVEEESCVCLE